MDQPPPYPPPGYRPPPQDAHRLQQAYQTQLASIGQFYPDQQEYAPSRSYSSQPQYEQTTTYPNERARYSDQVHTQAMFPSDTKLPAERNTVHDPVDKELLQEAHQDPSREVPEDQEEHNLDEHMSWIPRGPPPPYNQNQHLPRPVLVPQTTPGLQESFSRAWAPDLATYHVRAEEFLQFIDHLNICKAASPPFQVLNLAGTILGFTPIPSAQLISLGVSAGAVAGQVATAKVRITRYITRANKEYFAPRGLAVRIAKQDVVSQVTRQPMNAPLLADFGPNADPARVPPIRERRLMALGNSIAHLEFAGLAAPREERNMVDKLSAKMQAHKIERQERKHEKDGPKERRKMEEEMEKLDHEIMKVEREAQKEMRKKPEDAGKIERKRMEELEKIEKKRKEEQGKFREKIGAGAKDEDKAAKKFLWILVQDLRDVQQEQQSAQGL